MDAGRLNERVFVLKFQGDGADYAWGLGSERWARAEETGKNNPFSRAGLSAPSASFCLRRCEVTLHSAIRWKGRHYFLTAIRDIDRMYADITAARVELTPCKVWRGETRTNPDTKRTERLPPEVKYTFPGVLTEKYLGYRQLEPMAQLEETFVLVTPKAIQLEVADLVEAGGEKYAVQVCHILDEYKNEYEITRKSSGAGEE